MGERSLNGSKTEYTVSYPVSGGMDTSRAIGVNRGRLAYIENMYRDYEGPFGGALESVPGYRILSSTLGGRINAMHMQRLDDEITRVVIHSAGTLHLRTFKGGTLYGNSTLASAPDAKSTSFNLSGSLYILDGENVHRIKREYEYTSTADGSLKAYIPTAYVNGEEYEGRNILTDELIERVSLGSLDEYSFGSPGIYYAVTDEQARLCKTIGLDETQTASNISIPAYTLIDGVRYRVCEIGEDSFRGCSNIENIIIAEGIHTIGAGAFCDCTSLVSVNMPSTLATIGSDAFLRCLRLSTLYFGIALSSLSENAFVSTPSEKTIYYGGKEDDFFKISGTGFIADTYTFYQYYAKRDIKITLPLYSKVKKVTRVVIDGNNRSFDYLPNSSGVKEVYVTITDKSACLYKNAEIYCEYSDGWDAPLGVSVTSGKALIAGCEIATEYDGRIFLSGNKSAPTYVFYSSPVEPSDELYFPAYNYFTEGAEAIVTAILPSMDALLVFTRGDRYGGGIYYHTPRDSGVDIVSRIYPVSYIHTGICALGGAISFYDDPVFLTRGGLYGIDKQKISLERAVSARSHNINPLMLSSDIKGAMMTVWCGYLAIFLGTNVYLADSRASFLHSSGSYEYEWYMMTGIGSYGGVKRRVYKYSDMTNSITKVHERVGEITDEVVYTTIDENDKLYCYTEENGIRYAVYDTGMVRYETLSPPTAILSIDEATLIFGTDDGKIYTFNNDKRGVAPYVIASADDYDEEEYKRLNGRLIHPTFYTFDDVTPRYAIKLPLDDCGVPYLTKSTVNNSLVLKCTYRGAGEIICEVATDKNGYTEYATINGGGFDFSDISFDSLALTTDDLMTVPISERERGWIEKQIAIYSIGYATPIVIHSVSYRYTIKGKIKRQ